jgi:hypothetical protein
MIDQLQLFISPFPSQHRARGKLTSKTLPASLPILRSDRHGRCHEVRQSSNEEGASVRDGMRGFERGGEEGRRSGDGDDFGEGSLND